MASMDCIRVKRLALRLVIILLVLSGACIARAQAGVDVTANLKLPPTARVRPVSAVLWLSAAHGSPVGPPSAGTRYTLLQQNKMFSPHLLIVPVGATVSFPNADPFFHNVFSLFDGKRFDLGLYEAGTSKGVTFSREGVSYIFCNIHPEMSAVVIALSTPYFASAAPDRTFHLHAVPPGVYEMHVWVEGEEQDALKRFTRTVEVGRSSLDLGAILLPVAPRPVQQHPNKFGESYDRKESSPY